MTISMTGFSRSERNVEMGNLVWELRSVNHRFLDIHFQLPDNLRSMEMRCHKLVREYIHRGRIDARLQYKAYNNDILPNINETALTTLMSLINRIEDQHQNLKSASSLDVLRTPGILDYPQQDEQTLSEHALEELTVALEKLHDTRQREGQELQKTIMQRLDACDNHSVQLRQHLPSVQTARSEKTQKKLSEILVEVDTNRVAQEIALVLTKTDIAEELDRMDNHLQETKQLFEQTQPIGRRMDFLMQELHREVNTISAKLPDQLITNTTIDLKILIEQMREQTQNIE